jgi:hypothetical protein
MLAQKGPALVRLLAPDAAFFLHLPEADGHLGRAQFGDRNGLKAGFSVHYGPMC